MDALSGGIFHYKKDLAYNTSMDCSNRTTMLRRTTHSAARRAILWMCHVSTPVLWAGGPICLMARKMRQVLPMKTFFLTATKKLNNVAAVEAAEAHLAYGTAAGRAAVAAAGASEVASAAAVVSQA